MKEASKVIIWGMDDEYVVSLHNIINLWVELGKIQIVAYVDNEKYILNRYNGIPIFPEYKIKEIEYEYIVVVNKDYISEAMRLKKLYYVSEDKIICGNVFLSAFFDWERYIKVKQSHITLITESCYGGLIYHRYGLQFTSPFINIRINQYDYLKILENFEYYIKQPLVLKHEWDSRDKFSVTTMRKGIDWGFCGFPVFFLGDVEVNAVHAYDVNDFQNKWTERKDRMNFENLFAMMVIENDEIAERFSALQFDHKLGFYYKDTGLKDILYLKEYDNHDVRYKYGYHFRKYIHNIMFAQDALNTIDVLKMLNCEDDYYVL